MTRSPENFKRQPELNSAGSLETKIKKWGAFGRQELVIM